MRTFSAILLQCGLLAGLSSSLSAAYVDIVNFYASIRDQVIFPVENQDYDSIESAFGPRLQTTTQQYDWHRGIDIDGNLDSDAIYAPLDGYFYDYRQTTRGGYITILYHRFSDFNGGAVNSIEYNGQNFTRFYTWYVHLSDDGVNGNGVGSYDEYIDGLTRDDPVSQGTQIGILGNTGSPGPGLTYGPHLHWELRFGTTSSLDYQLDPENNTTYYGFDPHLNPMLLLEPYDYNAGLPPTYGQSLALEAPVEQGQDIRLTYTIDNDEMPVLNDWRVEIRDAETEQVMASHVLNYNTREGFDATTDENLDQRNEALPYIDPAAFGDTATEFVTTIVLPDAFTGPYQSFNYKVVVTAADIWGNQETLTVGLVPEPTSGGLALALCAGLGVLGRRR